MACLGAKYILVGHAGQIRIFDPVSCTFGSAKTSGTAETLYYVSGDGKGEVIYAGGTNGALVRSEDGGETWESVSGLSTDIKSIKVVSKKEIIVACGNNPGLIYLYDGTSFTQLYTSAPDQIAIKSAWGSHDDLYVGIDYGAYQSWGLTYYQGRGSTITPDTTLNSGAECDVFAGCNISNGNSMIATWNPGLSKIAIYSGSYGSWTLGYSTDVGISYRYYDAGKYADYNRTADRAFVKIDDPLNARFYLVERNSSGIYTLLGPCNYDVHWGGVAALDSVATSVAIAGDTGSLVIYNGSTFSHYAVGAGFTDQFWDVWTPSSSAIAEDFDETTVRDGESYCRQLTYGDLVQDDKGNIMRDYSPESRCTFRLLCRRGQYWVDPTLGSRLYMIKTLKDAKRKVAAYVDEALKPLVSEGTILGATIGEYYEDPINGMLAVQILINVPSATQPVDLGLIPLGRL